jgi:hypothetical protein
VTEIDRDLLWADLMHIRNHAFHHVYEIIAEPMLEVAEKGELSRKGGAVSGYQASAATKKDVRKGARPVFSRIVSWTVVADPPHTLCIRQMVACTTQITPGRPIGSIRPSGRTA